jgi:hypothetical protein
VSWLFAVEAESFLQEFSSFFIAHGVDSGVDGVNVHGVRISVGGRLRVVVAAVPGALVSLLEHLSEVPVLVVTLVVAAAVFSLSGSGVSIDLIVLDGF